MTFDYLDDVNNSVFVAGNKGKQGYVSNTLEVLVPFKYDKAYPLSPVKNLSNIWVISKLWHKHAIVKNNNKYGVVSTTTGEELLPCDFDTIHHPYYFQYGLGQEFWNRPEICNENPPIVVFAFKDNKWGCYKINKNKPYKEIMPHKYKYIWGPFKNNNYVYAKTFNDKFVIIDLIKEKEITELGEVDSVNFGYDYYGFCTVCKNNKWGIFSFNTNKLTHDYKYIKINPYPVPSNNNAVMVYTGIKQVGIVNPFIENKILVQPIYNNVLYENESFIVFQFGKKGIVKDSTEIVSCEYSYIENIIKREYNRFFIVQKFKNGKYGILDKEVKFTTALKYEKIKIINTNVKVPFNYDGGYVNINALEVPLLFGLINGTWEEIVLQ